MSPLIALGVIGFIGLIIVALVLDAKAREKRRADFIEFASRNGFQFLLPDPPGCLTLGFGSGNVYGDPFGLMNHLAWYAPFTAGHSHKITAIAYGEEESIHWYVFDLTYTTGSGKHSQTWHISGIAARLPMLFPNLEMRPQSGWDAFKGLFGVKDVQFESAEFNQRFWVTCDDQKAAYDLIHPRAMEYLMMVPERNWQFSGMWAVTSLNPQPPVLEFDRVMQDLKGFLALVPEYFVQDHGFTPAWRGADDL